MNYSTEIVLLARDIERLEASIAAKRARIAELSREESENREALAEGRSGYVQGGYLARYINHHLPTGREFPNEKEFISRKAFLDEMASWNRQMPNTYAYREA